MNPIALPILVLSYACIAVSLATGSYWGLVLSALSCIGGWLVAENT